MKASSLILAGGLAYGVFYLLRSRTAAAAVAPKTATQVPIRYTNSKQNPSNNGLLMFGAVSDALGKALGASWGVSPRTVQTIDWSTQGNAIGNYSGMTQDAANLQSTTDYNNQFISPFGTSGFAYSA